MLISKRITLKLLVALIFFSSMDICFSQENRVDSLKHTLSLSEDDSSRVSLLLKLAKENNPINKEQSKEYYIKTLQYNLDKFKKATILDTVGLLNWQLGNYPEAIIYFEKSLTLFTELKDSIWLGKVYNNLGAVNWGIGNSNDALEYYQVGLKIRRANNDMKGVSNILNNIGIIYQDWGLNDEAFNWHNKALSIVINLEESAAIAYSYSNIGKCYENKNELGTALKYYELGYKTLVEDGENNRSVPFFLTHIGRVNNKMGDQRLALVNHQKSLFYSKKTNNKNRIAISQYYLGKTFLENNQLDSASKYISDSYNLSLQKNYFSLIKDNEFLLSKIEETKGNFEEGLKLFKSASALKDSTFNKDKISKFTNLQVKYNNEQQTQENIILRKDNKIHELTISDQKNIRNLLLVSGLLIIIILVLLYRSRLLYRNHNKELMKSKKELLELNANKDKFFSIISHDLKSPFGTLMGSVDILESEYESLSKEESKEMIHIIKNTSAHLYDLVSGLLAWARIQIGRLDYKLEDINLYDACESVIKLIEINAIQKNIKIVNAIESEIIIFADNLAINTVLRNLISNGIKFTHPNGEIKIQATNKSEKVEISISDTGIGLNETDLKKLFRIDVHHTSVGTNNEVGTGVGLILCKELIEKHNGEIWVESELDVGSKFCFTIPMKE